MVVDLERRGDERMFITRWAASISKNKTGFGRCGFCPRHVFYYNHSRLLCLMRPDMIDIGEKGLYVENGILRM